MRDEERRSGDVDPRLKSGDEATVEVESKEADDVDVRVPDDEGGSEHLESG